MSAVLMILLVSFATLASQLLLKKGVADIASLGGLPMGPMFLAKALQSPYVIAALVLQAAGYLVWILVVSRVKLGYAFAVSGAFFYILLAAAGVLLFQEKMTPLQWFGVLLITAGVICMNLKPA